MLRLFVAVALAASTQAAARPQRIVSLNPCVDAVLLRVADARTIAAVSHYSHDPAASSVPVAVARRFAATHGSAEEVVALAPDLVIAGPHVARPTIDALRRLGIALVQLPVPATIAQSRAQVTQIAAIVGRPERGAALNAVIDRALAAARPRDAGAVPALIRLGSGMVPGRATLADELLTVTGFSNVSATLGLKQWDVLPLEPLLAQPPRVLFAAGRAGDRQALHPAMRRVAQGVRIVAFPQRLLNCAGPTIIDAVTTLASARRALPL